MTKEANNGFGPIPRKRRYVFVIFTSLVLVAVCIVFAIAIPTPKCILEEAEFTTTDGNDTSNVYQLAFVTCIVFLAHVASEFLRRLCLFVEELRQTNDRYEGSVWKALKTTYRVRDFKPVAVLFETLAVIFVAMIWSTGSLLSSYLYVYGDIILMYTAVHIVSNVLVGLKASSDVEISEYSEQDHLNVAHGLAWSYYFGYLKIILPELHNTIARTKWNGSMKAGHLLAKLFIIIPENCIIPAKIVIEDHNGMTFEGKLPALLVDRAGVKGRPYVNSVYQISDSGGMVHYCIMEFASPIDSLYQMSIHPEAGLNANERRQQVRIFMRTLQHILDTAPECANRYQLVPISGDYNKNPLSEAISKTVKENQERDG